jgi:hypothetical protein
VLDIVISTIAPLLRAAGFRRQARSFERRSDEEP